MWYALLLAIGSSTDNLSVGLTVGLKRSSSEKVGSAAVFNIIISTSNAIGAYLACFGGNLVLNQLVQRCIVFLKNEEDKGDNIPTTNIASLLAGIAFLYLGIIEIVQSNSTLAKARKCRQSISITDTGTSVKDALYLSIPMTLNNLAGGTVGGAAGISPIVSGVFAFFASYLMMSAGFRLAAYLKGSVLGHFVGHISGIIFCLLAVCQFWDYRSSFV